MDNRIKIIEYLKVHYPYTDNKKLSLELGLSSSAIKTIASRNNIKKNAAYIKECQLKMLEAKEIKYLQAITKIQLSEKERNIIVGSILGDGNLTYAPRSRNAYYREHFCHQQKQYREWKKENINSLFFRIEKDAHLKSPSHPIFSKLHEEFYINGVKTITKDNIISLNHPIGLACLFMDDGTLMINVKKGKNTYVFPTVALSTLNYSEQECIILKDHIKKQFDIEFLLGNHPSGKGCILRLSKIDDIYSFFNVVGLFCKDVPCLKYKWDVRDRLISKKKELENQLPEGSRIRIASTQDIPPRYTTDEENSIHYMLGQDMTYHQIAQYLGRSYWGICDKVRRLKKKGFIQ